MPRTAYLPGYTHLQRAQPVLLAHHLLAHGWALAHDVDRLVTTVDRLNVSPLGAGALAGSSLALDPDFVAAELGFHSRFENSLDAVSDRDFVAEALFDLTLVGVHLSRLGEELVLWSSEEFGFCTLDDVVRHRELDVAPEEESRRRRAVAGQDRSLDRAPQRGAHHPQGFAARVQPGPSRGQRASLRCGHPGGSRPGGAARVYDTVSWNIDRMQAAADGPAAAAIDLAELLVEGGMPFRQAHALVGGLVRESLERHVPLAELVEAHPDLGESAVELSNPGWR